MTVEIIFVLLQRREECYKDKWVCLINDSF
jgi:hypothetical protein